MSSEFEYRRLAAASFDLAKRAAILTDKTRLLIVAEAWLDLADRVKRRTANAVAEHPLVTKALGSGEAEARDELLTRAKGLRATRE